MTPDRYEDIQFEMNHELGNAEAREIDRRVEHARALIDPAVRDETATKGAALVREVLASKGRRKVNGKWTYDPSTVNEETKA